ncbi:hypothetical protein B0H34DRAFT_721806 [Crassisporium funariophilum]|nr:hypothetical protein B0H34DRAFT_721806 [Crassisporium funariophilum]
MADIWDQPTHATPVATPVLGQRNMTKPKIPKPPVVRDDWEDEEEEEDVGASLDDRNKRIWEDANTKIQHPMPSLIISRGSSATSATPSLPLNQPPAMRILKRPSLPVSSSSSSSSNDSGETFKDREARYNAARERIFGSSAEEEAEDGSKKQNFASRKVSPIPSPKPTSNVLRDPHGPNAKDGINANANSKGFGERKAKRPPSSPHPSS